MTKVAASVQQLNRLFHTLRHLQPAQLGLFMVRRGGLPARAVDCHGDVVYRQGTSLQPLLAVKTFERHQESFSFLNCSLAFDQGVIDWCPDKVSRLWRYHLHYFDMLRDPNRCTDNKRLLVSDWLENNPQGSEPAWEPYTASLRIVNWVSFFLTLREQGPVPQYWLNSLYQQVLWLEKNDERHILANHYFENIKAWIFAGSYFSGRDAQRWLNKGQRLLARQLDEQMLADGGHYERTPHYHCRMLENCLDLYNLSCSNRGYIDWSLETRLKEVIINGLDMLSGILLPDGHIPLFNDSARGASPAAEALFAYAHRLFGYQFPQRSDDLRLIEYPDSGLYGVRQGQDMLIVDCGDIGPAYQPGHTHCDFLSFELVLDGQPLIVDSGLYEYAPGEMRQYVRSTAAHNTISVDGQEQSEIWGEFRVARRAKKLTAFIAQTGPGVVQFEGSYRGFPRVKGGVEHLRSISCELAGDNKDILVTDQVIGRGRHRVESFLHFSPDIEIEADVDVEVNVDAQVKTEVDLNVQVEADAVIETAGDTPKNPSENPLGSSSAHPSAGTSDRAAGQRLRITRAGRYLGDLIVAAGVKCSLQDGWYCPDFGVKHRNRVLVMSVNQPLPVTLNYRIQRRI